MKRKDLLILFAGLLTWAVIVYGSVSFVFLTTDYSKWAQETRIFFIGIGFIIPVLVAAFGLIENWKEK